MFCDVKEKAPNLSKRGFGGLDLDGLVPWGVAQVLPRIREHERADDGEERSHEATYQPFDAEKRHKVGETSAECDPLVDTQEKRNCSGDRIEHEEKLFHDEILCFSQHLLTF